LLEVKLRAPAVHADVRNDTAGRNDRLTELECGGNAYGFDGHVDSLAAGELENPLDRLAPCRVDKLRRAQVLRDPKAVLVEVDHDYLGGRVELSGQKCREADGSGADDGDGVAG